MAGSLCFFPLASQNLIRRTAIENSKTTVPCIGYVESHKENGNRIVPVVMSPPVSKNLIRRTATITHWVYVADEVLYESHKENGNR
uniref:hypothetical protein n=1 Tax=Archaeoglobus fulgidus TaxID=2234 RepID=UPI00064EE525|nr:hypothetical protein [Archaeoglobus fulgidus]